MSDRDLNRPDERLRRLPAVKPPLLLARRAVARHRRALWRRRLVAAVIVGIGVGLSAILLSNRGEERQAVTLAPVQAASPRAAVLSRLDRDDLVAASGLFESALAHRRAESTVMTAAEAARLAGLENRLALIDGALATAPQDRDELLERQLWLGRLRTLDDMIRTYDQPQRSESGTDLVLAAF